MLAGEQDGSRHAVSPDVDLYAPDAKSVLHDNVERAYRWARLLVFDLETPGVPPVRDAVRERIVAELEDAEQARRSFRRARREQQRAQEQELLDWSPYPTEPEQRTEMPTTLRSSSTGAAADARSARPAT